MSSSGRPTADIITMMMTSIKCNFLRLMAFIYRSPHSKCTYERRPVTKIVSIYLSKRTFQRKLQRTFRHLHNNIKMTRRLIKYEFFGTAQGALSKIK